MKDNDNQCNLLLKTSGKYLFLVAVFIFTIMWKQAMEKI